MKRRDFIRQGIAALVAIAPGAALIPRDLLALQLDDTPTDEFVGQDTLTLCEVYRLEFEDGYWLREFRDEEWNLVHQDYVIRGADERWNNQDYVIRGADERQPDELKEVLLCEDGCERWEIGWREGREYFTAGRRLKGIRYWAYLPALVERGYFRRFGSNASTMNAKLERKGY